MHHSRIFRLAHSSYLSHLSHQTKPLMRVRSVVQLSTVAILCYPELVRVMATSTISDGPHGNKHLRTGLLSSDRHRPLFEERVMSTEIIEVMDAITLFKRMHRLDPEIAVSANVANDIALEIAKKAYATGEMLKLRLLDMVDRTLLDRAAERFPKNLEKSEANNFLGSKSFRDWFSYLEGLVQPERKSTLSDLVKKQVPDVEHVAVKNLVSELSTFVAGKKRLADKETLIKKVVSRITDVVNRYTSSQEWFVFGNNNDLKPLVDGANVFPDSLIVMDEINKAAKELFQTQGTDVSPEDFQSAVKKILDDTSVIGEVPNDDALAMLVPKLKLAAEEAKNHKQVLDEKKIMTDKLAFATIGSVLPFLKGNIRLPEIIVAAVKRGDLHALGSRYEDIYLDRLVELSKPTEIWEQMGLVHYITSLGVDHDAKNAITKLLIKLNEKGGKSLVDDVVEVMPNLKSADLSDYFCQAALLITDRKATDVLKELVGETDGRPMDVFQHKRIRLYLKYASWEFEKLTVDYFHKSLPKKAILNYDGKKDFYFLDLVKQRIKEMPEEGWAA
ncbi:putative ATPase, AAA-type, core [Plasmopara halstedii]